MEGAQTESGGAVKTRVNSTRSSLIFSLRWMLVAVAAVAICMAGLFNASYGWLTAFITIAFLVFAMLLLVAIYCPGAKRAFAIGFIVWGSMYAGIAGLYLRDESYPYHLPTNQLSFFVYQQIERQVGSFPSFGGGVPSPIYEPEQETFMTIGTLQWTLLIGVIGGLMAQWLWRAQQPRTDGHSATR
jgi:hypothetical protein